MGRTFIRPHGARMKTARIPPGLIVDTSAKVGPSVAAAVKAKGYLGIVRYVPHVGAAGKADITASETETILGTGLGLLLVQHVRVSPWDPAKYSGHDDGMAAASRALGIDYPLAAHIFCDLEGPAAGGDCRVHAIDYANDWADAVVAAGYRAGCYVGYGLPLSPQELYLLHRMTSYWSDAGTRQVAVRGFAMKQKPQITIAGVPFDPDVVSLDHKGETPFWGLADDTR